MNIDYIRKIDQYFGLIVCKMLLSMKSFLIPSLNSGGIPQRNNYKSILVIKFFGIGSILLTSPTLMHIKKAYPSAKITLFTLSSNRQVCDMLPSIDSIICLDISNILRFLSTFIAGLKSIKQNKFDVVIDLEFLTNFSAMVTLLVTLLVKPKETVGFNSPIRWRNNVYHSTVSFDHSRHITKVFSKIANCLGVNDFKLSFNNERAALFNNADKDYLNKLVIANDYLKNCDYFICININSGSLSLNRRWPKEHFVKVVKELIKKSNIAIFLIGGMEDVGYVSQFMSEFYSTAQIVNICGKTSINQLIGLFSESNLLITNDSGPLHIAQVIGLPTVSFFGPETPLLYGPIDNIHHVFYEDYFCSPCLNIYNSKLSHCKDNVCLRSISPESVLKVVKEAYLNNL